MRVWDLPEGRCRRTVRLDDDEGGWAVTLSSNGRLAAAVGRGKGMQLWEVGAAIRAPNFHELGEPEAAREDAATRFSEAIDGAREALGRDDSIAALGALEQARRVEGYERASAALSMWDKIRRLRGRGPLRGAWPLRVLRGHDGSALGVSVTADGRLAASCGLGGQILIFDVETGKCEAELRGHSSAVQSVRLTDDGRLAVSAGWDGTLRVWDVRSRTCLKVLRQTRVFTRKSDAFAEMKMTPDARYAATIDDGDNVHLWNLEEGNHVGSMRLRKSGSVAAIEPHGLITLVATDSAALAIDFPSGMVANRGTRNVLCGGEDGEALSLSGEPFPGRAFDAAWTMVSVLVRDGGNARSFSVTTDGRVGVVGLGSSVNVIDLELPAVIKTLHGPSAAVTETAVTADGRLVLAASEDQTITIWYLDWGIDAEHLTDERPGAARSSSDGAVFSIRDPSRLAVSFSKPFALIPRT
jgi:WD40 repeat protein